MSINPQDTAIMNYLGLKGEPGKQYYGKVLELREAVSQWLSYIPQTFPHYTRHTVPHSDEIILQVSKLLFRDEDPAQIVIPLSAVETYILIAAAYLHDAGMVASDKEKIAILTSEEWKKWTSGQEGGAERWKEIQALRGGTIPEDEVIRNFLADVQTRFLVAEFIRRVHHLRAADVIDEHQSMLGLFAFNDPILQRTIGDVCVAHGLRKHELEDHGRYPDRRDIRGQPVNVRLIAILLRLGDLLDMSCDRACPLLLNAACPLPANSFAHWTQYRRITSRLTAPDSIEISAECETQEEHRLLQDWCQWLVDEVINAGRLMSHAHRHQTWHLPTVSMGGVESTIQIKPSPSATYFPSRWTFELDPEAVLNRLIYNVYGDAIAFVRELIQNALDATRCQMYADLIKEGIQPPEYPTQVDASRRSRYQIRVTLEIRELPNPLSGENEMRQVLSVEDPGIGMDREIIQRYFLQVGRSYYTTDEFQRNFRFVPTSRFGVGFLSVFAVSDNVVVDTLKSSSANQDGPIRLTLSGPKNYLLTEKGERTTDGTRIEVLLREPIQQDKVSDLVSAWCRRVEFPIFVDDLGTQKSIVSESAADFTYEMPDVVDEGAKLIVRAFPVNRPGIEGELYVFAKVDSQGESWAEWSPYKYFYPKQYPRAIPPEFPPPLVCLHGIATNDHHRVSGRLIARIDYRREVPELTLSRRSMERVRESEIPDSAVVGRWEEILEEHMAVAPRAAGESGWRYKQALSADFELPSFWARVPETVRVYDQGGAKLVSLDCVKDVDLISTIMFPVSRFSAPDKAPAPVPTDIERPVITADDLRRFSTLSRKWIFGNRVLTSLCWSNNEVLVMDWETGNNSEEDSFFLPSENYPTVDTSSLFLPDSETIGFEIHSTGESHQDHILLNRGNVFIKWLLALKECCLDESYGIKKQQFKTIRGLLMDAVRYQYGDHVPNLNRYLLKWKKLPDLPQVLYPPNVEITREMLTAKLPAQ